MPRRKETSYFEEVFDAAWQLGKLNPKACLAVTGAFLLLFAVTKWIWLPPGPLGFLVSWLCALAAVAGLVGTINGYIHHHFRSRRLASARTLEDIRGLDWQEFEQLVADAYKRKGYSRVVETDRGPDGGIDIVLTGPDKVRVAVQCKQWRSRTIGEPKMRDFLGALTHQEFDRGIFITSSTFTPGAKTVAEKNRIELVDGSKLLELVKDVQVSDSSGRVAEPRPESVMKPAAPPSCPECGGQMVLRTARKGPNSGSEFWGCSSYPTCRGTQPLRQS